MSLILDALKRAERERQAERNPVLGDVIASRGPPAPSRWRVRLLLLAGLAALAAGAVWYWSREQPQTVDTSAADTAPAAAEVVPDTGTTVEPAPAPEEDFEDIAPEPDIVPGTETVTSLEELTSESEAPPTPPLPEARASAPPPMPAPAQPQAVAPAPEAPPGDDDATPEDPSAAPAATDARPVPPVLTQPIPRRKLREMPPEYRADFPALTVDVHVYERDTTRRFVIVNGRRYREGERLQEGPLLIEIVREGMVVDYRGEKVLFTLGR